MQAEPTATPEPTDTPTPAPTDTPTPEPTEAPEIKEGEMINRYGKTNNKVFFRKEASTNSKSQRELKKNTSVFMIYTQENELGETWTYAMVDGKEGYIMTTYLDLLTEEDREAMAYVERLAEEIRREETLNDYFATFDNTKYASKLISD